ncbi:MAG: hypothetical protein ABDH19_07445 [Thermodesulfovibrio sp.]
MIKITIKGLNTITYPHLDFWDWKIMLYLFLGGVSAGMLVMCEIANLTKGEPSKSFTIS